MARHGKSKEGLFLRLYRDEGRICRSTLHCSADLLCCGDGGGGVEGQAPCTRKVCSLPTSSYSVRKDSPQCTASYMMMMTFSEIIRSGDIVILVHTIAELLLQEQGTGDRGGWCGSFRAVVLKQVLWHVLPRRNW